jgi:hypothetical protein
MIPTTIRVGLGLLALVACSEKPPEMAKVADALPNIPLPPEASMVSREGGPEAIKLTLRSRATPSQVEAYYREILSRGGWRLAKSSRDADGALVLLAEQDGPPLWVRIQGASGGSGTLVELAGAVVPPPKAATPTS